jgi:hypothetical protein
LVQRRGRGIGQVDPGAYEQFPRLVLGEAQIAGADLGDVVGKPQPVQPDRRIAAR